MTKRFTEVRQGIDHGILSPSGKKSGRAHKAAQERNRVALFGPKGLQRAEPQQAPEKESLLRRAKELRDLAARGMSVRKFTKEAERLEAEAAKL